MVIRKIMLEIFEDLRSLVARAVVQDHDLDAAKQW